MYNQCSPITNPLLFLTLQDFSFSFSKQMIFISAVTFQLLKRETSGNILIAVIIQSVQNYSSDLYKKCQGRITRYCLVFSSQLSTSSHENGEFRSSTWARIFLSLLSTRERQLVITGYAKVSDSKLCVTAAMSIWNHISINCATVTGQTIQDNDQLSMNRWELA